MQKLIRILAAGALSFAASTATAAPVATTASLVLSIPSIGYTMTITGGGSVSVSGSTVSVGAGLVAQGATPIAIAVTGTTAIQSLTAFNVANASGTFSIGGVTNQAPGELCTALSPGAACNSGGGVGGAMGLVGTIWIDLALAQFPLQLSTIAIGQGGPFITPASSFTGDAGLWTTNVARVTLATTTPNGTVAFISTGSGSPLTLVTPTYINMFGGLGHLPLFARLTLDNVSVPEPGALLLLTTGAAGLATAARRRR